MFGGFGSDVDQGPTQGLELFSEAKRSVALTVYLSSSYLVFRDPSQRRPLNDVPSHAAIVGSLLTQKT